MQSFWPSVAITGGQSRLIWSPCYDMMSSWRWWSLILIGECYRDIEPIRSVWSDGGFIVVRLVCIFTFSFFFPFLLSSAVSYLKIFHTHSFPASWTACEGELHHYARNKTITFTNHVHSFNHQSFCVSVSVVGRYHIAVCRHGYWAHSHHYGYATAFFPCSSFFVFNRSHSFSRSCYLSQSSFPFCLILFLTFSFVHSSSLFSKSSFTFHSYKHVFIHDPVGLDHSTSEHGQSGPAWGSDSRSVRFIPSTSLN